jgi:hypothetical protein
MAVNQISFGKIVKVNASFELARQIEEIANGKNVKNAHLNNEVRKLFNDTETGEAHTFYYDKRRSYILSGKEGIKYWNSRYDAIENIQNLKEKIKDTNIFIKEKNDIWNNHRYYTFDLINKYGIDETITPIARKNKVRVLNINA